MTSGEPIEISAAAAVGVVSLLSLSLLFWLLRWFLFGSAKDQESGHHELPKLPFGWFEFGIFFWALIACGAIGIFFTASLLPAPPEDESARRAWEGLAAAVQTAGMQVGALIGIGLCLFIIRRRYAELFFRFDISGIRIFWISLDTYIRFLPVVWVIAGLWMMVLTLLQQYGVSGIDLEQQKIVEMLASAEDLYLIFLLGFTAVLLAPVVEEVVFRGILYRFLCQKFNLWFGLIFTNILFALAHANLFRFLPLFFLGLLLCWLYEKYKDIRIPILFHMFFNGMSVAMTVWIT